MQDILYIVNRMSKSQYILKQTSKQIQIIILSLSSSREVLRDISPLNFNFNYNFKIIFIAAKTLFKNIFHKINYDIYTTL